MTRMWQSSVSIDYHTDPQCLITCVLEAVITYDYSQLCLLESFFRMIRYKTYLLLFSILQKILNNKTSPYVSTYMYTLRLLVHWLYIPALLQGSIPIVYLENLVLKINEQQVNSKSNIMKEQDLLLCDSHRLQIKILFYLVSISIYMLFHVSVLFAIFWNIMVILLISPYQVWESQSFHYLSC